MRRRDGRLSWVVPKLAIEVGRDVIALGRTVVREACPANIGFIKGFGRVGERRRRATGRGRWQGPERSMINCAIQGREGRLRGTVIVDTDSLKIHLVKRERVVGVRRGRVERLRVVGQSVLGRRLRGASNGRTWATSGDGLRVCAIYLSDFKLKEVIISGKQIEVVFKRID